MIKIFKKLLLLGIGAIILFVLSGFFFVKETNPLSKADVIIVLGSPSNKSGKPSSVQKSRVNKGIELFQEGFAPKLLFTGGAAWNNVVESETMKSYAISKGIDSKAILTERKSTNTDENAKFSYEILKKHKMKSVIVVSSTFHTRRANFLYKRFPLKVQTKAAPYPHELRWKDYLFVIANEYFGFLRYFLTS